MDTNLNNLSFDESSGNTYFYVDKSGVMSCRNAIVRGSIYADDGKIGGWDITDSGLSNGDNIYIKSNGSMKVGDNFSVSSSGKLTVKSGEIAGWTITSNRIQNSDSTVYLNSKGSARFGNFTITSGGSLRLGSYNTETDSEISGDNDGTGVRFSVSNTGHLYCTSANIDGTIIAQNLYLKNKNNSIIAAGTNQRGNVSIDGLYINCKGLQIGTESSSSYFIVDSNTGEVKISGKIVLGEGSTLTWNQISDADSNLSNALSPLETDINSISRDLNSLDRDYSTNIGYVEDFIGKFGYSSISAIGANFPQLNAGWITAGRIDAELINTTDTWGITINGSRIDSSTGYGYIYIADSVGIGPTVYLPEPNEIYIGRNHMLLGDYIQSFIS